MNSKNTVIKFQFLIHQLIKSVYTDLIMYDIIF